MRAPRYLTAWAQHERRQHSQPPPQKSQFKGEPKPYRSRTATLLSDSDGDGDDGCRAGEKMKNYYKTFCGILMSTKLVFAAFMKNSKGKQQRKMTDGRTL